MIAEVSKLFYRLRRRGDRRRLALIDSIHLEGKVQSVFVEGEGSWHEEESDGAGEHWVQSDGWIADGWESSWKTTRTELLGLSPMQEEVMGLG